MHINEFSVSIYGELQPYSDVASKARVRIFYKYGNRNGTYITDDFAEKLISTLPYTVVSGIYSEEEHDFTDHGQSRAQSKIYGIVPENPNVSWEKHLDKDGIEREYACADVLIFTARYPEAKDIVGKSQSMELYQNTLKFHKEIRDGQLYAVFDDGCFLGLQALGDAHEPCFEGAAFYELQNTIESVITQIKNYNYEGGQEMPRINFKLSDSEKFEAIWALLNEDYNEEHDWAVSYGISEIYDDYALAFNYETGKFERVYYTKNDEDNSVVLGDKVEVYIMDITANEKQTIDTLRTLNGGTYEAVNEVLVNAEESAANLAAAIEKNTEFEAKISELNEENITLNTKVENVTTEYDKVCSDLEAKTAECEELQNYKFNVESTQKLAIITEYKGQLSDEVLESYREKINDYAVTELDKELAYELKKSNPSVFTTNNKAHFIPKDTTPTGIEAILSRYEK